jgi:hypothetical protein
MDLEKPPPSEKGATEEGAEGADEEAAVPVPLEEGAAAVPVPVEGEGEPGGEGPDEDAAAGTPLPVEEGET